MALIDAGMEEWGHAGRFSFERNVIVDTAWIAGPWSRYGFRPSFSNAQGGVWLGGVKSEVIMGGRVYASTTNPPDSAFQGSLMSMRDIEGSYQVCLRVRAGQIQLVRGQPDINWTILADSGSRVLEPQRAYFIEFRALVADVGSAQVWVDEVEWLSFSGDTQHTANGGVAAVGWGSFWWDDPYVVDTTGTVNNSRLGDIACAGLAVTGAGDAAQFTPVGAAANWDCVDEIPPDDATTYVQSSTVDQSDLHVAEDLPPELTEVKAVVLAARAQKSDAGAANIALGVKYDSDGNGAPDTESWGSDEPLSTSWAYHKRVLDQHPDGTPWSRAKLNALQIGYRAR